MAIAKKKTTRKASTTSTTRVRAQRATKAKKKAAKKVVSKAPVSHDVGAASDARIAELPKFKIKLTPTDFSHLRGYWTALEFELGHIKGETYPTANWELDNKRTTTTQYGKYWNSSAIYKKGHPDKFKVSGKVIALNAKGLQTLKDSCNGSGKRATNPEMIDSFRTAIKTGKAPKGTAASQYEFEPIKS